jgi:hypothetical protein
MYFFIKNIGSLEYLAIDIIVKIFLGVLVYCAFIVLCDNTIRNYLMKYLHAVHAKTLKKLKV